MDGRYIFEGCVPDGDLSIATVTPGEILQREFSYRVNLPPRIQEALNSGAMDPRNILTGVDGMLFDENNTPLLMVSEWSMSISFVNADYQAAGNWVIWGVPTGYSATLTFTEAVVNDDRVAEVLNGLRNPGQRPNLSFQGVLYSHNNN